MWRERGLKTRRNWWEALVRVSQVDLIEPAAPTVEASMPLGRSKKVTAQSKFYCNPWVVAFYDPPGKHARTLQYLAAGIQAGMWKMLKFAGWSLQYLAQWTNGIVTE